MSIETIGDLRAAIDSANAILVQPRFGCSEDWVFITKKEAREFLKNYNDSDTAADCQIGTDHLGSVRGGDLYLG